MIPKRIHYCWFGGAAKPREVQQYIASWRKYCPDYEIKEWNESNFDIHCNRYCQEAYANRKWAFVSDVARVYALYHEGGIYMDTDVEVIKSLDPLLLNKAFIGFEGTQWIGTNMMGAVSGNLFFKQFLENYAERSFLNPDGTLIQTTNVEEITRMMQQEYAVCLNGQEQQAGDFRIYPSDRFSPYDYLNGKVAVTPETYSIHWFSQSWIPRSSFMTKLSQLYHRLIGVKMK